MFTTTHGSPRRPIIRHHLAIAGSAADDGFGGSCPVLDVVSTYRGAMAANRTRQARAAKRRKRRMDRVENDLSADQWTALKTAWGGCAYRRRVDVAENAARLRAGAVARRSIHPRQRRARMRVVQFEQVQRRTRTGQSDP